MRKFLFYDNLVKGAGLGHLLATYNYGLTLAQKSNLIFMPCEIICGHGFAKGEVEKNLGLGDFKEQRKEILNWDFESIHHIPYQRSDNPVCADFSLTRDYFRQCYSERKVFHKNLLNTDPEITNITISIRRGDLATAGPSHPMWNRLKPSSWYLNTLEKVLDEHQIPSYRLLVFSDGDYETGQFADEYGQPENPKEVFKNHQKDFIFSAGKKISEVFK